MKLGIIRIFISIGMPLFFVLSGFGSAHSKDSHYGSFLLAKIQRLILPFIVAIFMLLIPRLYFAQEIEPWTRPDASKPPVSNFFDFALKTLPSIPTKLSWLWFLIALFGIFVLNYPMIRYLKRRKANEPFSFCEEGHLMVIHVLSNVGYVWLSVKAAESKQDGHLLMNAILIGNIAYVLLALAAHFQTYWLG